MVEIFGFSGQQLCVETNGEEMDLGAAYHRAFGLDRVVTMKA